MVSILNMLTNTKYQDAHIEHGLHHQCHRIFVPTIEDPLYLDHEQPYI